MSKEEVHEHTCTKREMMEAMADRQKAIND
jgi:hypothetical protein